MTLSSDQNSVEVLSRSPAETEHLATELARVLLPGDVVTLEGELGAGKTCFVRGLAQGLGIDPGVVSSPTFVIAHEYEGESLTLIHVDAYRIHSADDLESIGWAELIDARDSIIAIEWPERVEGSIPSERIAVTMNLIDETEREIRITATEETIRLIKRELPNWQTRPEPRTPRCRSCGQPISIDVTTFPFCSSRCRMADLGGWFRETHRLTRKIQPEDDPGE